MSEHLHSPFLDVTDEEFTKKHSSDSLVVVLKPRLKHIQTVRWSGILAGMDIKLVYTKPVCPFCFHELRRMEYSGSLPIVNVTDRRCAGYVRDCWTPLFENGVRVWTVVDGDSSGC